MDRMDSKFLPSNVSSHQGMYGGLSTQFNGISSKSQHQTKSEENPELMKSEEV